MHSTRTVFGGCVLEQKSPGVFRGFSFGGFLSVFGGLFLEFQVFNGVFGSLCDDPAAIVESLSARASAHLVKVARSEDAGLLPIVFAELREKHGANRHIDPHSQRVGPADHLEQPALGELLDEHPVLRQQSGVMQTDAVPEPFLDLRPVWAAELEPFQSMGENVRVLL